MIIIFLVHKTMVINYNPYVNHELLIRLARTKLSLPFRAAYIYTDVFLILSSMLLSYSIVGKLQKRVNISWWKEVIGRYIGVAPPFLAIVVFSTWTLPLIGSGPMWSLNTEETELCRASWWRNFLMIHNYFGIENICLPQTHHVATEYTLYAASILLVIGIFKSPKKGGLIVAGLGLSSMVARFWVVYSKQLILYLFHGVE